MGRIHESIYKISAVLDGSLMSVISRATSSLQGLKAAASGQLQMGMFGNLGQKLSELRSAQAALERMKQLQRGGLEGGLARYRDAAAEHVRLQRDAASMRAATTELKARITELRSVRDGLKGAAKAQVSDQIRALKEQRRLVQGELSTLESKLRTSGKTTTTAWKDYQRQVTELRQLQAAMQAAGMSVIGLASAEEKLKAAIASASAAMKLQEQLTSAHSRMTAARTNLDLAWGNMQGAWSTAGTIMEPFKAAVDNAETFEHEMSRVRALTQSKNLREGNYTLAASEMRELEAQARELGATTQFTMTQAAQAQGFLGMAGWSKAQIMTAMPGMLDLAAASGMDLARTADIVSDNLTALGMQADEVGHMTDVYAYALTRSNLNMESLGESMKYAAPAMHAYGGDIHDAAAAMMIMGNAGIKGSMAGTALRMGLLRLAGPPKKASKEMDALGVSLSDATRMAYESQAQLEALGIHMSETMMPHEKMAFVLKELGAKMSGLSKDEKLAAVGAIFGVNAASGWLAVLEQGPEKFAEFRDALIESDGTAKQIARTMNDDTRGAWLYLESAIDAVSNNIGSAFLPALKTTYEALNPVVTSMAKWIGEHPGVVQGLGAIAAAAATAVVGLGAFRLALAGIEFVSATVGMVRAAMAIQAFSGATSIFGALSTAIMGAGRAVAAFAAEPWGLAIAAIAAVAYAVYENWEGIAPYVESLWSGIVSTVKAAADALKPIIDAVMAPFERKAAMERRVEMREELSTAVSGSLEMGGENLDELTRATRSILRKVEDKTDEQLADEIWSRMSGEKQTDASQSAMAKMLRTELAAREELTSERRASIESIINERMVGAKQTTVEAVRQSLTEFGTKLDLTKASERESYLSNAKAVLSETSGLTESERQTLLGEVKVKVDTAAMSTELSAAMAAAVREKPVKTLSDQDALVRTMLSTAESSSADLTTKLTVMKEQLSSMHELNKSARDDMSARLVEGLQAATDARLGDVVSSTIERSSDVSSAVENLTSVLSTQKDQSAESVREMISTVTRGLEKSGKFESSEVESIVSAIQSGLKEVKVSRDDRSTWESVRSELPVAPPSLPSEPLKVSMPWQNNQPSSLGATKVDTSGFVNAIRSGLSDLFSIKTAEAATTSSAIESASRELTAAASQSAAEQSAMIQNVSTAVTAAQNEQSSAIQQTISEVSTSMTTAVEGMSNASLGIFDGVKVQASEAGNTLGVVGGQALVFANNLDATSGATQNFSAGVTTAGAAAAGAAAPISGLGAAASSAISSLMNAASSVGSAISGAISSAGAALSSMVGLKHNARGGIYPKGEFVTTFAEESPEAAIPIDGSKRSVGLWQSVGRMLGVYQDGTEQTAFDAPPLTPTPQSIISPKLAAKPTGSPLEDVYQRAQVTPPPTPKPSKIPSWLKAIPRDPGLPGVIPKAAPTGAQQSTDAQQSKPSVGGWKGEWLKVRDRIMLGNKQNRGSTSILKPKTPFEQITSMLPKPFGALASSMQKHSPLVGKGRQINFPPQVAENTNFTTMSDAGTRLTDFVQPVGQSSGGGRLERSVSELERMTDVRDQMLPPITLHFHFEGNVNREDVKAGVEESLPKITESFEQQYSRLMHERRRRSY